MPRKFIVMNSKKSMILSVSILAVCASILFAMSIYDNPKTDNANNDGLHIKGHFHAEAIHSDGTVFATVDKDNLITSNGFKGIAKLGWTANSGITPSATYRYLAIGATNTAASSSDTALGSECGYSRQLTSAPTYSAGVITLTGSFTGTTCTAVEVGVFDASTTGNMLSRQVYSTVTLGSSDTFNVTYTYTLT